MAVFHFLRERNGRAAVRVEGHDPVVRDRADIVCTRRDGVGRPDVVQNVVADLLIGLGRRVQSPPNRFLRQPLVCARCVREVLVVAYLCASVNKFVDSERRDVAAGFAFFRYHRHNVLIEIDERYGDAVIADIQTAVHAVGMDAVGLAAGRDLGNLAPVGRRMGELDQIVNAGFYRRGCPRIVFPADVPAQRVLGVQVVRRILLERLHKVCDREGHDPCGIIRALCKRILLPGNTRLCGILSLTAVHVLVAVLPEAVDAGDGNKVIQRAEDIVAGRLDRRPLRNIGHSLRDRFRNFGLPACEGVAGVVRVFAERGGSNAGLEVGEDHILEELAVNAVGVGDGEGVGGRCYFSAGGVDVLAALQLPSSLFVILIHLCERGNGCRVRFSASVCQSGIEVGILLRVQHERAGILTLRPGACIPTLNIADREESRTMAAVRRDALHPNVERRVRIIVVGIGFGDHIGLGVFGLRAAAVGMRAAGDGAVAVVILDVAALPDRVDGLGAVCMINDNRVARLILRSSRSRTVSPALEGVAVSARPRVGNGERYHAGVGLFSLRVGYRHIGYRIVRDVIVIGQGVGLFGCIPCNIKLYWGIF